MTKKLSIALLTVLLFISLIACLGCKTPTEPVYQGMTISRNNNYYALTDSANVCSDGQDADNRPNNGEFVPEDGNGEMNEEIEDIITIEVKGDDITKYYVKPNETFIVQVHVSNPDDYEIQSFTLNGQKYASYMFLQGSTMELLLLEVQAPSTSGYLELTIDAIKYIDGTDIKDVRMDGSKTIKAGVAYEQEPTATVTNSKIDTTKATFTFSISDPQDVIGKNTITAYLTDGENKIAEQTLKVGANTVTFDNLTMGKTYQYGIATSYDLIDGYGVKPRWLLSNTFTTLKAFTITNGVATQDSVTFNVEKTGTVGNITSVKLYDYDSGSLIDTLNGTVSYGYGNLLSNHAYLIEVNFDYVVNEQTVNDSTRMSFTTLAKTAPTVTLEDVTSTQTSIGFDVVTTDVDNILTISKIELYLGETLAQTAADENVREFTDLLSNNEYTVKVTYTYDLNDGNGVHTQTATASKRTVAKTLPTVTIDNVTSTQTSLGFGLTTADVDGILNITAVELLSSETVAKTLDKSATTFNVTELTSGTMYTIKVTYAYDLNDGAGVHTEYATKSYPTLVESVAVTEVSLVNNNQVRLGEELNLRVYFDNPNNVQLTNIYVNGQKVQVSGGDRKTYAIVRFATVESGLIDFYVDRVDYMFSGVEINQHVDSLAHVTFPVFTDLDVKFEGVSASPYEYTGGGIYLYFDNPQNYKVYKINDSTDFMQISDNEFYTTEHKLTSIEYGYDDYGATTQALNMLPYNKENYDGIHAYFPVYTADDFINMSGDGSYLLMNDIDMRNVNITQQIALTGHLNGNGHTIRGLHNVIDTSSQNYFNLFSDERNSCSIFDINFTELYISIVNSKANAQQISLLGNVRLYNCTVNGDFNASGNVKLYEYYDNGYHKQDLTKQYNDSNTFNLNTTINGVSEAINKVGVKIVNNALEITDDGGVYYHCGDNATVLLGCYNKDVSQFTIRDDTIAIGESAFYGCIGLTSITIYSSVASMSSAFYDCSNLTKINYLGPIESWCKIEGLVNLLLYGISDRMFSLNGESVTELVIPNTVTSISSCAFSNCTNITRVTFEESSQCTSIGSQAFYFCSSLTSLIIGNGITTIGSSAFYGCRNLANIYYAGAEEDWNKISIGYDNYSLTSATRYYYSETEPALNADGTAYDGNYWHYDNGEVIIWTK